MPADLTAYYNTIASLRQNLVAMQPTSIDSDIAEGLNIAENTALSTAMTLVEQQAKTIADNNISDYYANTSTDAPVSPPNVATIRSQLLKTQAGEEQTYNSNAVTDGRTTGQPVNTSNSEFPYQTKQPAISVPTQQYLSQNPDRMTLFKSLSGVSNIPDLYAQNATTAAAIEKFSDNNLNKDLNTATAAVTPVFPTPGQPIVGLQDIAVGVTEQTEFNVGGTDFQPPQKLYKSWVPNPARTNTVGNNIGNPTTPSNNGAAQNDATAQKINDLLKQQDPTVGSYKFFIEKLHGRMNGPNNSKQPYKKNPVSSRAGELIPSDLENRMVFPAYVTAFNDSYDSSWDSYDFIGRGEPFWAWKSTTRSLTIEFYMMSDISAQLLVAASKALENQSSAKSGQTGGQNPSGTLNNTIDLTRTSQDVANIQDGTVVDGAGNVVPNMEISDKTKFQGLIALFPDWGLGTTPIANYAVTGRSGFVQGEISGTPDQLWERVTFLTQCVYGWYREDGKLKEQPIVRIRIADFFDVNVIINSLVYTQDEFDVDLNISTTVGAVPTAVKVAMNCTVLHEDEPSSEYRKFYHRKDRDIPPVSNSDQNESPGPTLDATLNSQSSKSPFTTISRNQTSRGPLEFPAEAAVYEASLKNLDSSLSQLQVSGGSLKDAAKRDKLATAIKSAVMFLKIQSALQALTLPASASQIAGAKSSMANQPLAKSVTLPKLFNSSNSGNPTMPTG